MRKVYTAISNLPDVPTDHIYWVAYNEDMIKYIENEIIYIKGEEYLRKYVTVVTQDKLPIGQGSKIYFDKSLHALRGLGYG